MVITCYRWTAILKYAVTFVAIVGFTVPGDAADLAWLGSLGGSLSGTYSWANGVNADGLVVVGGAYTDNDNGHAFRWTLSDNTMHDLGTLGGLYSEAYGVNVNGSVVVGSAYTDNDANYHAFRWTLSDNTMHDLGTLGGLYSQANGVNADGTVVVGWASTENSNVHASAGPCRATPCMILVRLAVHTRELRELMETEQLLLGGRR